MSLCHVSGRVDADCKESALAALINVNSKRLEDQIGGVPELQSRAEENEQLEMVFSFWTEHPAVMQGERSQGRRDWHICQAS